MDSFNTGVAASCKQAGLTPEQTARVAAVISDARDSGVFKTADWRDNLYERALRIPAPVLMGGAAALASVPITAIRGAKRQRELEAYGVRQPAKRHYLRNAVLAGSLGAAAPLVLHNWGPIGRFNADRAYRQTLLESVEANKDSWKAMKAMGAGLNPGRAGSKERQNYMNYVTEMDRFNNDYVQPLVAARETYGSPNTRWRYLFRPRPQVPWPTREGLPPSSLPVYWKGRLNLPETGAQAPA
jgi:hypothetical protein